MARALRCLLIVPLGFCLWRLWAVTQRELVWAYIMPFTALLSSAVAARLLTPWIRLMVVRASGKVLLRKTGFTAGVACDAGLLLVCGALLWGDREVVAWVFVATRLYILWALIALMLFSCFLATRDIATLDRARSGEVILVDGGAHRVWSMHRIDHDVTILAAGERRVWRIDAPEVATVDTLVRWLREP